MDANLTDSIYSNLSGIPLEISGAVPEKLAKMYNDTVEFESKLSYAIPTIFGFIIFLGLIGNVLVILVVSLNRHMKNSTNSLIINLAISDLLFLTICIPFTAADYVHPTWDFPDWWCGMLNYLQYSTAYASVWTLVLMSIDRFLAVVYPIRSLTLRSMKNTTIAICLTWTVILLVNIPVYFEHRIFRYHFVYEYRSVCTFYRKAIRNITNSEVQLFYFSFNIFGYLLPLGINAVLYCVFLRRLWSMSRPGAAQRSRKAESLRAKKKVTWMVAGVIVTFAVCWLPLNICFFITGYFFPANVTNLLFIYAQIVAQVLAYTNSCLNPILYAFLSETFRSGFLRLLQVFILFIKCRGRNVVKSHLRLTRTGSFCHTTAGYGGVSKSGPGGRGNGQRSFSKSNSAEPDSSADGPRAVLLPPYMGSEPNLTQCVPKRVTERSVKFNLPSDTPLSLNSEGFHSEFPHGFRTTLAVPLHNGTNSCYRAMQDAAIRESNLRARRESLNLAQMTKQPPSITPPTNEISKTSITTNNNTVPDCPYGTQFPTLVGNGCFGIRNYGNSNRGAGKRSASLEEPKSPKKSPKIHRPRKGSTVLHSADFDLMFSPNLVAQLSHPKIVLTEFDSEETLDPTQIEQINSQV